MLGNKNLILSHSQLFPEQDAPAIPIKVIFFSDIKMKFIFFFDSYVFYNFLDDRYFLITYEA